jgi:hypothetical protein
MTVHYIDIQAAAGVSTSVDPLEQSFTITNAKPYTVVCTVSVPLGRFETARTFTVDADAGVTGESAGSGAITQTLTIPSGDRITYALSSTYESPTDEQSNAIDSATDTAILTVTVTTYNGVGLSPVVRSEIPLVTAVLGDGDLTVFDDGNSPYARSYNTVALATEFFRAGSRADAQQMLDWIEAGRRGLKDFMDLYDWAVAEGFTGR